MAYDSNNTFILRRNDKGDNPKRPDYRGEVTVDGKTYELAGWIREPRNGSGKKFVSGTVKPKEPPKRATEEPAQGAPRPASTGFTADDDEDTPF